MTAAAAMISQGTPVLETSNLRARPWRGVDDVGTTGGRAGSGFRERRCDELGDGAMSTVSQDATMLLAARFDGRASVVHWVVAVTWTARGGGDDPKIASRDQHLGMARVAVVL
ncbi:MAG TPA: hypothetical protein VGD80_07115 [Kofleriaceae bacterium]